VNTRISKGSFRRRWGTAAVGHKQPYGYVAESGHPVGDPSLWVAQRP